MKILIRADASLEIGSGHIMRCLTLARALRLLGHQIHFICREHAGHLGDVIIQSDFSLTLLPTHTEKTVSGSLKHSAWLACSQEQDFEDCLPTLSTIAPDWVICDHYALSDTWETLCKQHFHSKLFIIDDLADRKHCADILLDQNISHSEHNYTPLVPKNCRLLIGTKYALLRPEFAQMRNISLQNKQTVSGSLKTILVNLGGVDKDNFTLKILHALQNTLPNQAIEVIVVMGKTAPHTPSILAYAQNSPYPCRVLVGVNNMAELMSQSDLAIGAAGSTSWERCCLGLPTLQMVLADNQQEVAQHLQQHNAAKIIFSGSLKEDLQAFFTEITHNPILLKQMSQQASLLCDGKGVEKVLGYMMNIFQAA